MSRTEEATTEGGGGDEGDDDVDLSEYRDESFVPKGEYDFPNEDEDYVDDGMYSDTPYRHITDWWLSRRGQPNLRLPLPKSFRNMVLYGELEPCPTAAGNLNEGEGGFKVYLSRTLRWSFDRSHSCRGIWIETSTAWYKLKRPCRRAVVGPGGASESQESVHAPMRAKFGLLSNISDMLGERPDEPRDGRSVIVELHSRRTPRECHALLTPSPEMMSAHPELNSEPFDMDLLRREAKFVRSHLKDFDNNLTAKCRFMTGLGHMDREFREAKREGRAWAVLGKFDYLSSARRSETRSGRLPWGCMKPGVDYPHINRLLEIRQRRQRRRRSRGGRSPPSYPPPPPPRAGRSGAEPPGAVPTGAEPPVADGAGGAPDRRPDGGGGGGGACGACGPGAGAGRAAGEVVEIGSSSDDDGDDDDGDDDEPLIGLRRPGGGGAGPPLLEEDDDDDDDDDDEPLIRLRRPGRGSAGGAGVAAVEEEEEEEEEEERRNRRPRPRLRPRLRLRPQRRIPPSRREPPKERPPPPPDERKVRKRKATKMTKSKARRAARGRTKPTLARERAATGLVDSSDGSWSGEGEDEEEEDDDEGEGEGPPRRRADGASGRGGIPRKRRRRPAPEDAPEGGNGPAVVGGVDGGLPERTVSVLSKPKDFLTKFAENEARRRLWGYLDYAGGSDKRNLLVADDRADAFLREVVNADSVPSMEVMLVALRALRYSSRRVIRSLFDRRDPGAAACRAIFGPWLGEANRRMESRRRTAEGRSLILEAGEAMSRTEEEIAIAVMRLIKVSVGPTSLGGQSPDSVKEVFGVDLVCIVNQALAFAHRHKITSVFDACDPVKKHLLMRSGSLRVPRRPSGYPSGPALGPNSVWRTGDTDILGAALRRESIISRNKLIRDCDQMKLRIQEQRRQNTKRMEDEERCMELETKVAFLTEQLKMKEGSGLPINGEAEGYKDDGVGCAPSAVAADASAMDGGGLSEHSAHKRPRLGRAAAALGAGAVSSSCSGPSLNNTLLKITEAAVDTSSLSSHDTPSLHPSPPTAAFPSPAATAGMNGNPHLSCRGVPNGSGEESTGWRSSQQGGAGNLGHAPRANVASWGHQDMRKQRSSMPPPKMPHPRVEASSYSQANASRQESRRNDDAWHASKSDPRQAPWNNRNNDSHDATRKSPWTHQGEGRPSAGWGAASASAQSQRAWSSPPWKGQHSRNSSWHGTGEHRSNDRVSSFSGGRGDVTVRTSDSDQVLRNGVSSQWGERQSQNTAFRGHDEMKNNGHAEVSCSSPKGRGDRKSTGWGSRGSAQDGDSSGWGGAGESQDKPSPAWGSAEADGKKPRRTASSWKSSGVGWASAQAQSAPPPRKGWAGKKSTGWKKVDQGEQEKAGEAQETKSSEGSVSFSKGWREGKFSGWGSQGKEGGIANKDGQDDFSSGWGGTKQSQDVPSSAWGLAQADGKDSRRTNLPQKSSGWGRASVQAQKAPAPSWKGQGGEMLSCLNKVGQGESEKSVASSTLSSPPGGPGKAQETESCEGLILSSNGLGDGKPSSWGSREKDGGTFDKGGLAGATSGWGGSRQSSSRKGWGGKGSSGWGSRGRDGTADRGVRNDSTSGWGGATQAQDAPSSAWGLSKADKKDSGKSNSGWKNSLGWGKVSAQAQKAPSQKGQGGETSPGSSNSLNRDEPKKKTDNDPHDNGSQMESSLGVLV